MTPTKINMNIVNPKTIKIVHNLPPLAKKGDKISIDSEFFNQVKNKLHRAHGDFAFLGCSFDGETVYYIDDETQIQEFFNRLDAGVLIFHNAKYDYTQLRPYAHMHQRKNLWDSMLIEQIMWSGYFTDFSLADLVRRYLDTYMSKEDRKEFSNNPDKIMTQRMIEYSCADVAYTWKVFKSQKEKISDSELSIWRDIELPFLWTILAMGGVKLDTEKWIALAKKNEESAKAIQDKYEINLNSPKQVKEYFSKCGINTKSTDVEALEGMLGNPEFQDVHEFAQDMLDYRKYAKRASTYGEKFVTDYVEPDGKIYADLYQIGAECMPSGELVLTNRGYLPVEDVVVGDLVITHEGRPMPVTNTFIHSRRQIYRVRLFNGLTLRTTGNHPYLLKGGKWKQAKNLQVGDVVVYHSRPEIWKPIDGWENYSISSWGRVGNHKTNRIMALQPKGKWGHLKVTLVRNASRVRGEDRKDFAVHRLVAEAFVNGQDDIHNEVRHLNGIAWDNTDTNLCWGTSKENKQDAIRHGTMSHRYTSSQTKITDEMVSIIRRPEEYYRGRDGDLAKEWDISREMVRDVRLGKRWQEQECEGRKAEFGYTLVTDVYVVSNEVNYGIEVDIDHSHVTGGIVTHNTGRTSCRAPNLQNQPHETEYRECFIADDGNVMVVADWGAQEPRIAAYLSQDEGLMEALNSDEKLYVRIARDALGINITKLSPEYGHIKSTVLGIFYGMGAKSLGQRIGVSEEEAQEMIDAILDTYPGVREYMNKQRKASDYVESIYGRKIWLNKYSMQWERNALNAPIQSSAADAMKIAAYRFVDACDEEIYTNSPLRLIVHDEIVVEDSTGNKEWIQDTLSKIMVEVAEEMHDGIRGSIEIFSGSSWACKR